MSDAESFSLFIESDFSPADFGEFSPSALSSIPPVIPSDPGFTLLDDGLQSITTPTASLLEPIIEPNHPRRVDDDDDNNTTLEPLDVDFPLSPIPTDDDGSFGDDEEVDVAVYSWKIDHSTGHHRLRVPEFQSIVRDPQFDGARALEMIQRRYTLDYGSRKAGARPPNEQDEYHPVFFLDMLIIIGRPLRPITQFSDRFFDNITVSLKHWRASYSHKHIHGFSFDLTHRTFRIATAATREIWFIVMHPIGHPVMELPESRRQQRQRAQRAAESSALQLCHAQFLATYIKQIFQMDELLGQGVEASWKLDGPRTQNITFNKWTTFQQLFMDHWASYIAPHGTDLFWRENLPAFHAYDYGANIEIQVNDHLQFLPKEISLRPMEDESDEEDPLVAHGPSDGFQEGVASNHLPSQNPYVDSFPPAAHSGLEGSINPARLHDSSHRSSGWNADGVLRDDEPTLEASSRFYPEGLAQLHTELEQKYLVDNISSIAFALAVDLNCIDISPSNFEEAPARCLLADRNLVAREFPGASHYTFYPLAFHPAYGNFSSPQPPHFLTDHVLAVMRDNMSYRNGGADPLSFGYFQAYCNIKRSIRHGPDDLLATKGIATAALTLPESEVGGSRRVQAQRQRLRRQLLGLLTPDDPEASQPFARERRQVEHAIHSEEFAFRMEQVVNVQISRLVASQRSFVTVLRPIFQLIRFYLQEPEHYTHFLRSFPPSTFPGVLVAYAELFHVAIEEIRARLERQGTGQFDIALAEGVAALDRLGSYCFTGFPRSLMGSVLKPLDTIESIEQGAWPYLNPRLLDLQPFPGHLNAALWPRDRRGRPLLMHIAALSYHYGAALASSRSNHVWFLELGIRNLSAPSDVTKFLEELFRDLWIPQMVRFIHDSLKRSGGHANALIEGASSRAGTPIHGERDPEQLKRWVDSQHPFSWREYEPILSNFICTPSSISNGVSAQARQDYSRELYAACLLPGGANKAHSGCFASPSATWFSVLSHIVQHHPAGHLRADHWVAAISAAMLSNQIDCVPGTYQSRLNTRRVIRLMGHTTAAVVLTAPAGSVKRAALEAQHRAKRPKCRKGINFGCRVPFTKIPDLVEQGFASQEQNFRHGDRSILEHYQVARNCLEACLGDPLCDLMLMIVMTFASCSITPTVLPKTRHFSVGPRKDPGSFAANLVTRMLWFLRPQAFPQRVDKSGVLCIPEMTKKMEHKGVNNRLLREIGWVRVINGNRDAPRNSDLLLEHDEKLMAMRKELRSLRHDAVAFIGRMFQSRDSVWVDRCSQIISADA